MAEIPTEVSPLTFEVDRGGRRFPLLPEATKGPPQGRIRELQVQPSEEALPQLLSQAICRQLAWHEVQFTTNPSRDTVVAGYIGSLKQLGTFRDDVQNLVREACRANLEFRQGAGETLAEARDAVLNAKREEMMALRASTNKSA